MASIKENNIDIQILRGLAIISVLIRHAIAYVDADAVLKGTVNIIACFHMAAFFLISGYLFQKKLDKYLAQGKMRFLLGKARYLLIPYVFWTVLLWGGIQIGCAINGGFMAKIGFEPMSFWNLIYGLLTYQTYYTEHLWFLYVLFVFFVVNIVSGKALARVEALPVALALGFLTYYVELPQIIERCMLWSVFFLFGRYIAENRAVLEWIRRIRKKAWLGAVAVLFLLMCALRLTIMHYGHSGMIHILARYAVGFTGVWLLYGIAVNMRRGRGALKAVGDDSYEIYLMHNPYCVTASAVVLNDILGINPYIAVVLATIVGVAVPMAISRLVIRKIKPLSIIMTGKG